MQPYSAAQMEEGVGAALAGAPARGRCRRRCTVDGEGVAATSGQRDAELARLGALGMTPDVEAAGQRHPARRDARARGRHLTDQ